MRYLFTLTYYSPYISGLTLYVKRLVDRLPKSIKTMVLCMNHADLPEHEDNIVRAKPDIQISKGFLSLDWLRKFWRLAKNHDVIFINLPQFEGFLAAIVGRVLSKKVVAIYHCDIVVLNPVVQLGIDASTLLALLLADRIISYTHDYALHSKFLRHFLSKVMYVYPPIPKISKAKVKRSKKFTVGIAARLAQEKGIEYLLEAVKNLDCLVLIAGPENPVGEEDYRQKIQKLITNKVKFLGTIPSEKMNQFYSQLDVLVLPSVNSTESFGMVQVEAMMCGIPVIASDLPGVREVITVTGNGILVPPKDAGSLKLALQKIKAIKVKPVEKIFDISTTLAFYAQLGRTT